jgi:glyoxylase-like metal-dependent hydrolase (beta-lactamase superfamily II)
MIEVARDVWLLPGFPKYAINAYLIGNPAGDVLIDARIRWARNRILRQLEGRKLSLVALTHVHPDHQGCASLVCEKFGVPLACHPGDIDVMEGRKRMEPDSFAVRLSNYFWSGPARRVEHVLQENEAIAGFRVVHTPGHTPGHVTFFRDSDRVAIIGDVFNNMNVVTGIPGVHEPPWVFSVDPRLNRLSMQKVVELRPSLVLFGHGPPLRDASRLKHFMERIEQE